jgi:hypothetical protein
MADVVKIFKFFVYESEILDKGKLMMEVFIAFDINKTTNYSSGWCEYQYYLDL